MAGTIVERPVGYTEKSTEYLRLVAAKREKDPQKESEALERIKKRSKSNV